MSVKGVVVSKNLVCTFKHCPNKNILKDHKCVRVEDDIDIKYFHFGCYNKARNLQKYTEIIKKLNEMIR